jgi:SAM-dependent methyltransferase
MLRRFLERTFRSSPVELEERATDPAPGEPISAIAARYERYSRTPITDTISRHDDMYSRREAGAMNHYMHVGRSAIRVIASALVAAEKPDVRLILDLPCGGGRVTRHLRAFFPEAEIYVSDLNKKKESFVVNKFGAISINSDPDLSGEPERTFDLIFVGSLVTHFDEARFVGAVDWFARALSPDGILVLTTHGRRHEHVQVNVRQYIDAEIWSAASADFAARGFGYVAYPGQDYGLSVSKPSWLMGLIEQRPGVCIVAFHEAAWDYHQDVLVLQKRSLFG